MDKDTQKKLKRNIKIYYLYEIMAGMFFSVPIMVLFWQANGLSLKQIMILQSLFSLATVVLEVPTGYFADLFGRKKSLILAGVFWTLGIIIYSLGYGFYQFLIAELVFAIGNSFRSGADSAFVYDTLVDLKEEKRYKKIWGNTVFIRVMSLAFSAIIGGLIAKTDLRLTLYVSIPFFAIQILLAFLMKEPKRHKVIFEKGYLLQLFNIFKKVFVDNKKLKWLIIYSGIVYGFNQSALWLYQPYFKLTGLDIMYFGFVFAGFNAVSAFTSKYAYKLEEKIGQKYSLIMLVFLVGISYLLMSSFVFLFSFSFCFLQQFVRGYLITVVNEYVNKLANSSIRATILSVQNMLGRLFYAMIIPIIGWVADVYTLTQAMTILGITVLLLGFLSLLMLKKVKII